jgi:hypothetical protein
VALKAPATTEKANKFLFFSVIPTDVGPAAAFFGVQKCMTFAKSGAFIFKDDDNHYLTGICLLLNIFLYEIEDMAIS